MNDIPTNPIDFELVLLSSALVFFLNVALRLCLLTRKRVTKYNTFSSVVKLVKSLLVWSWRNFATSEQLQLHLDRFDCVVDVIWDTVSDVECDAPEEVDPGIEVEAVADDVVESEVVGGKGEVKVEVVDVKVVVVEGEVVEGEVVKGEVEVVEGEVDVVDAKVDVVEVEVAVVEGEVDVVEGEVEDVDANVEVVEAGEGAVVAVTP